MPPLLPGAGPTPTGALPSGTDSSSRRCVPTKCTCLHITPDVRAGLAEQELDELPDGSHEIGVIEWIDYRTTAGLPLFPPIGPALAALPDPRATVGDAALDAVTDDNYTWL